jgi:HlyD family secretion protein
MFVKRIPPPQSAPDEEAEAEANADSAPDPRQSLRRYQRIGLALLGLLLLCLLLAASLVRLSGAVVGQGELVVASRVKTVTHPNGGVIAAVLVREGDSVRQGDPLIRFDSSVTQVSAAMSDMSLNQLLARRERLRAERDGLPTLRFPSTASDAVADEIRLFALRRAALSGEQAQLRERVHQREQQIVSYQAQIAAYRQQAALIEPERQGVRDLWERRLVTINRLNELERTAVSLQGSIAALQADIAQARAGIAEIRQQAIQLTQQHRSEAATFLAETEQRIAEQRQRAAGATDSFERSTVRAPASGLVDQLAYATVGSVIPPAQPILRIVPQGPLEVEARIAPSDIDQLHTGQSARIGFPAFNRQTTPEIHGTLDFLSAERTDNPGTGESFYVARITLPPAELQRLGGLTLVPGMPAEVYLETGSRSLLSYLFKPLADQFARAFREN